MRSNASRLPPEAEEFQRRNRAASHYGHLAITEVMRSWALLEPCGDIGSMVIAGFRRNPEVGAQES
jgi:hypothetical protein